MLPSFSDFEQDYTHQENTKFKQLAALVTTMQLFGELHTCEREAKNALGTYCGSKDRQFIFIGH